MTLPNGNQKCLNPPPSGPVGCLPAPNIFYLANEFAKGKMFWNFYKYFKLSILEGICMFHILYLIKNNFSLKMSRILVLSKWTST